MNTKVFSQQEPDPVGQVLGTRFNRFKSNCGIEGLAREPHSEMIEILAVHAEHQGNGQFRNFVTLLKSHYKTICIWHVDNPILERILPRYGFEYEVTIDEFGQTLTGFRWDNK